LFLTALNLGYRIPPGTVHFSRSEYCPELLQFALMIIEEGLTPSFFVEMIHVGMVA
jgi:hypothetical protein